MNTTNGNPMSVEEFETANPALVGAMRLFGVVEGRSERACGVDADGLADGAELIDERPPVAVVAQIHDARRAHSDPARHGTQRGRVVHGVPLPHDEIHERSVEVGPFVRRPRHTRIIPC